MSFYTKNSFTLAIKSQKRFQHQTNIYIRSVLTLTLLTLLTLTLPGSHCCAMHDVRTQK